MDARVVVEDDERQLTRVEEIYFALPAGFHAHNDLVATALMATVSGPFRSVRFPFPISRRCADGLAGYFGCKIGPVDDDLEPRRPGRYLGLAFSGGLDSVGVLTMLRDLAGVDVRLITGEFDGFYRESVAYASYERDVSCHTNFRARLGDAFRFDAAIPILFADFADLAAFAGGHTFGNMPLVWTNPLTDQPEFTRTDPLVHAAGITEVHIARCLLEPGLLQVIVRAAPDRIEMGLHGTGREGERKHGAKVLTLRALFERSGTPMPGYLRNARLPVRRAYRGVDDSIHLRAIFIRRFVGQAQAALISPRCASVDWTPVDGLRLDLFTRYNTILAAVIPDPFREPLLTGLRACGVEPYRDDDHLELEALRRFILAVNEAESLTF